MKNIFVLFICSICSAQALNAQCVANAGGNKHICPKQLTDPPSNGLLYPTVSIGGTPTATGGVPPYTYAWFINPIPTMVQSIPYLYTPYFLNDTSLSNPDLHDNTLYDSIVFYLIVKDAVGNTAMDNCQITWSSVVVDLVYWTYFINKGDSVYLNQEPNIFGGYRTSSLSSLSYTWRPSTGLRDSTLASGFWAKPDSSVDYTAHFTDNKGCKNGSGAPTYEIRVCPEGTIYNPNWFPNNIPCVITGIKENTRNKISLLVYPNPVGEMLNVECEMLNGEVEMKITDVLGKEIMNEKLRMKNEKAQINVSVLKNGIYFLQMYEKGKLMATQKVIRE